MKKVVLFMAVSAVFLLMSVNASAQVKTRVRFPAGTHGTTVTGTVRGYAYHDYIAGASAGQTMDLSLTATGTVPVFSVLLPNGDNLEGASESNDFSGALPVKGDYVIRVLMMRSAARRKGSVSNYTLKISIK